MRGVGPQAEMGQDCLNHVRLVDKSDDAHGSATAWTQQGIGLMDLLDQVRPALPEEAILRIAKYNNWPPLSSRLKSELNLPPNPLR